MTNDGDRGGAVKPGAGQAPSAGKTRYERSLSPPRSSSSSGYGTGSSSKSFMECNGNSVTQGPSQVRSNGVGQSEDRFRETVGQSEAGTLTSTSSGQSCDERWYDFMDQPPSSSDNSPPPLPTRVGSKGPVSAFQTVSSTPVSSGRRSTNERPRRSAADQSESSKSSPDSAPSASPYQVPVTKYSSVSGPRAYNGYESASSSDTVKSSSTVHITGPSSSLDTERRSGEARSTYLTDYELNNNNRGSVETEIAKSEPSTTAQQQQQTSNENYLVHNRLAALKTSPVQHQQPQQQHATYSNVIEAEREERLASVQRSEDELSQVSASSPVRPRSGRRSTGGGATTPSSTTSASSRGHSPRTVTEARPEVTGGHQVSGVKKKVARSARNSANLAGSSLQEDLMRLISPEYNQELPKETKEQGARSQGPVSSVQDSPLSKLPKKTLSELSLMKSRSRENIARLEVCNAFQAFEGSQCFIFPG